jgi:hypothetical protein
MYAVRASLNSAYFTSGTAYAHHTKNTTKTLASSMRG